jgi:hypothetical protein
VHPRKPTAEEDGNMARWLPLLLLAVVVVLLLRRYSGRR